ncbi:Clathrin heavy chain 1 [Tritrichomonas foetus]|uniref:Clathrin heavy chain n=1 Tax=Tritrichomonas foetus TaxID=1144522 RepID=A0A1J4KIR3_9EUKA|nr:Clathrin heavy chain 1 [Tritrichomonas foetus]|eukprot:OHT11249.1 Clathrin heavy chain 1 [Tritrichomonas foetus]
MKADTAVMHPSRNIIALRGASVLQVFDLNQRQRLKSFQLPEGQVVNYWKWTDEDTLAFVAGGSVYHWTLSSQSNPVAIFPLQGQLASGSIMNYSVSHDQQWLAVSAIVREGDQTVGKVQLFSRERNVSQVIDDTFAASFANVGPLPLLVFASKANGVMRMNVFPLGATPAAQQFGKKFVDIPMAQDAQDDLPLQLIISSHYSTGFLFTKHGYLYLVEIETPFVYLSARVSQVPFTHAALARDGGVIALSREGRMAKFGINNALIVDFIATRRANPQAAGKVAAAAGLQISGDFMNQQFDQLLQMGNFTEAARLAANSPGGALRNQATIAKLQRLPNMSGGPPPVLQYFSTLLDSTKLNDIESIELCRIVMSQNKTTLIEKWIKEDKLTPTEELGDLCKPDPRIALAIYLRANVSPKIVASFAELGMFDKLQAYCQKFAYTPNWMQVATIVARQSPEKLDPVLSHIANNGQPIVDPKPLVQMLLQFQLVKPATGFLIDVLTQDREEDSDLQTLLFEIALNNAPKIAEELFTRNSFTFYDRQRVAALCERAGNFQRALEHYTDLPSIKRCIVNTQSISQDFLVQYFDNMSPEWSIDCLRELLISNPRANVQLVVYIAGTYWEKLGIDNLINLFHETNSSDGIYYFLAQVVNTCPDPDIHFRYIEAAAKLGNFQEVERMCNESEHLQAERVRDYLIQQDLPDKIPLIVLCNRFEFVEDLTKFLYKKSYTRELETYVQKFNPSMAGRVIGALIDIEAPQDYITKLLNSVQHTAPIDDLITQTMKRERIKLLEPILYGRAQSGATDSATNNGLVLLAVLSNRNGEKALRENQYYDPKFVGEILAKRDAHLACLAFAKGNCDDELIELTNQHQLYKEQARYCVARQSPELWARVLSPDNEHMKLVVDAVISTALPECDDPDKVSQTVKAFIEAQIPTQLLGLLEKVVMESPQFQNNVSLQNLLIITAIKSDTSRVMTYVTRLNDYTWDKICEHLIQAQLYDEAIAAFKKFGQNVEAVRVMLIYNNNIQAASDWAQHCDEPAVWGEVARAQLSGGFIVDAIDSFIKAKDTKEYNAVIQCAESQSEFKALVSYLSLARQINNRDPIIETELCYAYAKTDMLAELEELTSSPNSAREKEVADRCFDDQLFKAAKILYTSIKDFTRLTETLLELQEFQAAIEAARKAGTSSAWKAVNKACVLAGEFKVAQSAGLQVVVEADLILDVISLYENLGYFEQIIQLLEAAMSLERAHGGIFTELAVLYAKHQPEKVMEHLKAYYQRIALFKVIKQLNAMHLWNELTYAYDKYNEFDNAVLTMMDHPAVCWRHQYFKDTIAQVSNADIIYRSLNFYLQYDPLELNDLLSTVGSKVDASRVVDIFKRTNNLQLIKTWLASIQANNVQAVNEALNSLYIEDGDYESLRQSIDHHDLYEAINLARSLENHECLEFRRISSYIYRKQQRWNDAINLSKKDSLYGDCIETAAQSRSSDVVDPLLKFFCQEKLFECFAAATYVCYDLVQPDVILELAWRNNAIDFAMPYLIQNMREQNATIAKISAQLEQTDQKVDETKEIAQTATAIAVTASQQGTGYAASPFPDAGFPGDAAGFNSMPPQPMPGSANAFAPGPMGGMGAPMGGFPPQAGSAGGFGNFPPPQFPPF